MAYQALKNRADAEDVMQTALLRLLERDTAFESEAHMRNWLIRVAIIRSACLPPNYLSAIAACAAASLAIGTRKGEQDT